jgi:hypothetical protein
VKKEREKIKQAEWEPWDVLDIFKLTISRMGGRRKLSVYQEIREREREKDQLHQFPRIIASPACSHNFILFFPLRSFSTLLINIIKSVLNSSCMKSNKHYKITINCINIFFHIFLPHEYYHDLRPWGYIVILVQVLTCTHHPFNDRSILMQNMKLLFWWLVCFVCDVFFSFECAWHATRCI